MTRSAVCKLSQDIEHAADDVQRSVKRAGVRIGEDAEDAVAEASQRLRAAARDIAAQARSQGRALAHRATLEAKARPVAASAIAGVLVAALGVFLIQRARREA